MSGIQWYHVADFDRTVVREQAKYTINAAKLRYNEVASSLESLVRPEWQRDAACRGVGPKKSHPEGTERGSASRAGRDSLAFIATYCDVCTVKAECLAYALEHETVPIGVWGGLTVTARGRLMRGESLGKQRTSGIKCGTDAGYMRHRRAGELACRACTDAHTAQTAAYKRKKGGA